MTLDADALIVIGSVSAAATSAAEMGKRVALIEGDKLGLRYPLAEGDWPAVRAHIRSMRETIRGDTLER
ncbi:MAG: hypothetical protein ABIQ99_10835, partial [Thermoflexales bacterium]